MSLFVSEAPPLRNPRQESFLSEDLSLETLWFCFCQFTQFFWYFDFKVQNFWFWFFSYRALGHASPHPDLLFEPDTPKMAPGCFPGWFLRPPVFVVSLGSVSPCCIDAISLWASAPHSPHHFYWTVETMGASPTGQPAMGCFSRGHSQWVVLRGVVGLPLLPFVSEIPHTGGIKIQK